MRAVTQPYPGAFTFLGQRRLVIWRAAVVPSPTPSAAPGTVLSASPLVVAAGKQALSIEQAQPEGDILMAGAQASAAMGLKPGIVLGQRAVKSKQKTRVLILGVNGFIGNALSERLLQSGKYIVHGMDLHSDKITRLIGKPDFFFNEGDISIHREWIEYHVRKCDVILPLVAIATPIEYTRNPLRVFNLDFEENLRVVRYCVKYNKRIIFPSTSEVYGMCDDEDFDETTPLILGPIRMQRWIYSCSKQLLDRVIWAYGERKACVFAVPSVQLDRSRLDSLTSAVLAAPAPLRS